MDKPKNKITIADDQMEVFTGQLLIDRKAGTMEIAERDFVNYLHQYEVYDVDKPESDEDVFTVIRGQKISGKVISDETQLKIDDFYKDRAGKSNIINLEMNGKGEF